MAKSVAAVASSTAEKTAKSIFHKAGPLLPPWVSAVAAFPVALGVHERFGASPWTTVGLTLTGVTLTAVTWHYSSKRAVITRIHSALTTGLTFGWLTASAIIGMSSSILNMYLLGGGALALSWNIRHATRNTGRAEGAEHGDGGLFEKVGLARTLVRSAEVKPNKVTASLQLPPGEKTADDAVKARGNLASAMSVPANGVRVMPDRDHHDRVNVTFVPVDALRNSPVYTGPSAPGGTMREPLHIGVYEDGEVAAIRGAAANPRLGINLSHLLLVGTSGAGKSATARDIIAEIGTRREATIWAIDVVKRRQTLGCAEQVLDWFATDRDEAYAMIDCLPEVIAARTDYLASRNMDNWEPGCGLNHLTVWIEEFAPVLRDLETFTDAAAAARSAGLWLVLSGQRVTFDNLPTSVRNNINDTLCLGVRDDAEAVYALGSEMVQAGANPAAWTNQAPGMAYLKGAGIDKERQMIPLRAHGEPFISDASQLTALLTQYAHLRDPLDAVTAMAAGSAYKNRKSAQQQPRDAVTVQSAPASPAAPAGPQPWAPDPELVAQNAAAFAPGAATLTPAAAVAAEPEPDDLLSNMPAEVRVQLPIQDLPESEEPELYRAAQNVVDRELPAADAGWSFGDQDAEDESVSKEEAERMVDDAIRRFFLAGQTTIRPKDLVPLLESVRSRTWVQGRIKDLVAKRVLAKVDGQPGTYKIRDAAAERELAGAGV
jgi:hypothetical protein